MFRRFRLAFAVLSVAVIATSGASGAYGAPRVPGTGSTVEAPAQVASKQAAQAPATEQPCPLPSALKTQASTSVAELPATQPLPVGVISATEHGATPVAASATTKSDTAPKRCGASDAREAIAKAISSATLDRIRSGRTATANRHEPAKAAFKHGDKTLPGLKAAAARAGATAATTTGFDAARLRAAAAAAKSTAVVHADATMHAIKGVVTDTSASPLLGIQVEVMDTAWNYLTEVWTDVGGHYSIDVDPGDYYVYFYDPSEIYGEGFHSASGFSYNADDAATVTVSSGDVTVDVELPNALHVKGQVTDMVAHNPLPNIYVDIYTTAGDWYDSGQTDPSGNYSVTVVPGDYIVAFWDGDDVYASGFYSASGFTYSDTDATAVVVTSADATADIALPLAIHIKGTVTDEHAAPLSEIEVDVMTLDGYFYGSSITDGDGAYSVKVDPGFYNLYFYDDAATYGDGWYGPSGFTYDANAASQVPVVGADVTVDISLPLAMHIEGRVTRSGGVGLPDIDVEADGLNGWTAVTTESDGTYSIPVGPGAYALRFSDSAGTYASGWYSSAGFTYDSTSATPVIVSAADVTGKNVTLPLAIHIKGKVSHAGVPLADIEVYAYTLDGRSFNYSHTALDGTYSVTVGPGTYVLGDHDGSGTYGSGYYHTSGFTYLEGSATLVTVSAAGATGKNFILPLAVHINGTVTDTGANPLEGIQVDAFAGDSPDVRATWTDADGNYSLAVAPNSYTVHFADENGVYASGYYSGSGFTYDSSAAAAVAVSSTDVVANVSLPSAIHVTGRVTSGATPLEGITVQASTGPAPFGDAQYTAADGTYSIAVPPGNYQISFQDEFGTYASGWYSSGGFTYDPGAASSIAVTTADVTHVDVDLPAALHIEGTVTRVGGGSLAGIWVVAQQVDGGSYNLTWTLGDGSYSLVLPPGGYQISFYDLSGLSANGYYSTGGFTYLPTGASTVTLSASDVTGIDVTLPAALHIKGKVTRSGGVGLADIEVDVWGTVGSNATSALDGTYSVSVAPGSYTLRFSDSSGKYGSGYYSSAGFTYSAASATTVAVSAADVTGKNVTLPTAVHIKGKVTRSGGVALSSINVYASSASISHSTMTLADGTYSVAVAPGSYTLEFWDPNGFYAEGYYSTAGFTYYSDSASLVAVSSADATGKNVVMPSAHYIKGRVTDTSSVPLGAVDVIAQGSRYYMDAMTAPDGSFSVQAAPDTYSLDFYDYSGLYASGFLGASGFTYFKDDAAAIVVTSTNVTGQNVMLPRALYIKGKVTDAGHAALANVEVDALRSDHRSSNWRVTASNGTYAIEVAPGSYTMWARDHTGANGSGFYSTTGFVYDAADASPVVVTAANVTGIDIEMVPATHLVFPASAYTAINPRRVLDTRPTGGSIVNMGLSGVFTAGTVRTFQVGGAPYVGGFMGDGYWEPAIPWNAVAVTGNVTIVNETAAGLIALGPTMTPTGEVTTINFVKGDIRANNVTVGLGLDGSLSAVFRSTVGATTQLIFDVTGYFVAGTDGATYHPVAPGRVLDTRPTTSGHTNIGLAGKFANRKVRTFAVAGVTALGWLSAMVPSNATAVTGNVTVTNATSVGFVSLGPTMTTAPSTSTLNVPAATNRANGVTVALKDGRLSAVWVGTTGSSVDVIFDVTGFFTADVTGLSYHAIEPTRVLDSSISKGLVGPFVNRTPLTLAVGGLGWVPADAAGISGNLTVVNPSSAGFAFISPDVVATPTSSTVNTLAHQTVANGFDVPLSSGSLVLIWCGTVGSTANLQLDVTGYWK